MCKVNSKEMWDVYSTNNYKKLIQISFQILFFRFQILTEISHLSIIHQIIPLAD